MATTPSPRSPGEPSPSSTRQMLDELDALMQRMLALPVNQLEDDPVAPASPGGRPASAAPLQETTTTTSASPPSAEIPTARKVVAHPPATLFPQLPHRTEAPVPEPEHRTARTPADEPAVIIPPVPEALPATPSSPSTPLPVLGPLPRPIPRPAPTPAPARPRLLPYSTQLTEPSPANRGRVPHWLLRPLLWSNRVFDRGTGWLGGAGRWLRGPMGRTVLGWVGLGLWAIALILLVMRFLS